MARWYERPSLAFGDSNDVTACAQVFADVETAMSGARPKTVEVGNTGNDVWSGESADEVRELMTEIPELLRRFSEANGDVANALRQFAPRLSEYQSYCRSLQQRGHSTGDEIDDVERLRESTIDRLRSQESDLEKAFTAWTYTYSDHPEVAPLNARLERLMGELAGLERQFDLNGDDFEAAVDLATDVIWSADGVLYNNGWDKFWSQTLKPVLDVVRVVLEIATVVLVIAALIGSGGTLAPLILAGLLLTVSATQVIGTAAAGREVTGEMWLNLALDIAAVATLGAAHYAKGLKVAAGAHKVHADKLFKATKGQASFKHAAKLKDVERLTRAQETAEKAARGAEMFEGGLGMYEGGVKVGQGNNLGFVGIGTGLLDVLGVGGAAGNLAAAGHTGMGAVEGVGELAGDQPDAEPRPSKEWPGLDGLDGPQ